MIRMYIMILHLSEVVHILIVEFFLEIFSLEDVIVKKELSNFTMFNSENPKESKEVAHLLT